MKPADRLMVRNGKRVTKASNLTTYWMDFVYTNMLWLVKIATNMIFFCSLDEQILYSKVSIWSLLSFC